MSFSDGDRLVGRRVRLRPVAPTDLNWLYTLASTPGVSERWRLGGALLAPAAFERFLKSGVWSQFVIERRTTEEAVGLTQIFGADHHGRTAHFSLLLEGKYERSGWPIEGVILQIRHAFEVGGFRKLYFEIPAYNLDGLGGGAERFATQEARLSEHFYFDGTYHDVCVYSLSVDSWDRDRMNQIVG